jgi:hypothetical protein
MDLSVRDRYQVNQRSSGMQLNQADGIVAALDGATQYATVETRHPLQVNHSQHEVVKLANVNHRVPPSGSVHRAYRENASGHAHVGPMARVHCVTAGAANDQSASAAAQTFRPSQG